MTIKLPEDFASYFDDVSEVERGDFLKHDYCAATRSIEIDDEVIALFPTMSAYKGCLATQNGTISYNYGWDSIDEIELYRRVQVEPKVRKDYFNVLSHLNAEENSLALEFAQRHFPMVSGLEAVNE